MPDLPARDIPLPKDYDDAVFGRFKHFWRPAIQAEIDSLFKYGVWELQKLPPGALILPCKMVFKVKPNGLDPPGISKFKTRYCGKGFYQQKGIHYLSSTAPVAASMTTRLVIAFATEFNWPLLGNDVRNAYLNAPLDPNVVLFVKPPPTVKVPAGYGLRLKFGLYGTMQGGNRWGIHKHKRLSHIGMIRSFADPSLYHRHDRFGFVLTSINVDDFAITGYPPSSVSRFRRQLSELWDITDCGELRLFASIEIERDRVRMCTTLRQHNYIHDMLAKYGLTDTYGKDTPCTKSIYEQRLLDPVCPHPPNFNDDYASQVGTLGYLRWTRPDLCVALGVAAQFAKRGRHGPQHYRALRNIMRYAGRTDYHGLHFVSSRKRFTDP